MYTVENQLTEPSGCIRSGPKYATGRALEMLELVGVNERPRLKQYPYQLSGTASGDRHGHGEPDILIADGLPPRWT